LRAGMQPIPALSLSVRGRGRMIRMSALGRFAWLVGIVCLGCAGCQGFNFFGQAHNTPVPKEDATASAQGKPGRYSLRVAPYVFLSDYELNKDQPLFRELAGLRDQVYQELKLAPTDRAVLVYLFEDRDRYESYMQKCYPNLPKRRAFFIAQP